MPDSTLPAKIEAAIKRVRDEKSFIQDLLIDTLGWEIDENATTVEEVSYDWSLDELRAEGIEPALAKGNVSQLQPVAGNPWGVFLVEFNNPDLFTRGRGMTGPLRKILRGLVPSKRRNSNLPSFKQENLLFVCTHNYQHYRFAYFKAPLEKNLAAPLAAFGWSPGEPIRTLCEHNLPLLEWPRNLDRDNWIAAWAAAFDVEKVTKRFYEQYEATFTEVEGQIKRASGLKDNEELRLFTQSLFNRLMFLRFVERKRWLQFPLTSGEGKGQGNAVRYDYLAALVSAGGIGGKSVYHSRLRPLFFEGLAIKGKQQSPAIGKVPFLNGGLFDETELDHKAKDVPDSAILPMIRPDGLFYKFNFTVEESTPLDIEVAVDPEMLGKVFERLVTGRHETGSYYTPKSIVQFMCREALQHYLATALGGEKREALERLVDEHSAGDLKDAEAVLEALRAVKVCDPACGSGAYLLGMLQELLALRSCLFVSKHVDTPSAYKRKLEIIENNLYGVDNDEFAVNIARLRLWLSLAVEYEGDDPPPLPNLDFKVEVGDSLAAPDPQAAFTKGGGQQGLRAAKLKSFREAKAAYLDAHGSQKQRLKARIDDLREDLATWLHSQAPAGTFDWAVEFAEVFEPRGNAGEGGFDIVLANPPYIRQELIKDQKPRLKEVFGSLFSGTADLYVFFYLRGLQLLRPGGMLVFISSNKWFRAGYGEKLRAHIARTTTVQTIVDFHDLPVFEAIAYPMIFTAKKQPPTNTHTATLAEPPDLGPPYPDVKEVVAKYGHQMPNTALGQDGTWHLITAQAMAGLSRRRKTCTSLADYTKNVVHTGVKSGLNGAFVIDSELRDELIAKDKKSGSVIKPLIAGRDVKRWKSGSTTWIIYLDWQSEIDRFPSIKRHLLQFRNELERRNGVVAGNHKWWCLERPRPERVKYFEQPKIVYQKFQVVSAFTLGKPGEYLTDSTFMIPGNDLYLLAVLNSKPLWDEIRRTCALLQGGYQLIWENFRNVDIPAASASDRSAIGALAQKCLDAKGVACEQWEKEIDDRVAGLYGL
jgi:hypothetical protein